MATLYDISQLKEIDNKKEAIEGKIYQTVNNKYFKGENGRIIEVTDLTLIDQNTTNITNIIADITELENRTTTLEANQIDKCFVVAMSMIF